MSDKAPHDPAVPTAIEMVVRRLGEMESVFGPAARPLLDGVRDALLAAMAARDRGDVPEAIRQIERGMQRLAELADRLDPGEAALMRILAQQFGQALLRGEAGTARQSAAVMFEKSGAVERQRS